MRPKTYFSLVVLALARTTPAFIPQRSMAAPGASRAAQLLTALARATPAFAPPPAESRQAFSPKPADSMEHPALQSDADILTISGRASNHPAVRRNADGRLPRPVAAVLSFAAVAIIIIAAVALTATLTKTSPTSTSPPPPASSPTPAPSPSPSPAPAARAEATAISNLLTSHAGNNAVLAGAIQNVRDCTATSRSIRQIRHIRNRHKIEYIKAQGLSTSALPEGIKLKSDLTKELSHSISSDNKYLSWARQENTGCKPSQFSAGATDSQASRYKTLFVELWNPIAIQYGLPQKSMATM